MRVHLAIVVLALAALPLFAQEGSLAKAAHANDFATFDALYRAKPVESFRPLHELWTYSVTDPGGAFYGQERYQELTRAYPAFAATIAPHRIVDSRGNIFYPSAETRAFLLAQAESGTTVPRTVPRSTPPSTPPTTSRPETPPVVVAPRKPASVPKVAPATPPLPEVPRKRLTKASLIVPSVPVVSAAAETPPKAERSSGRGLLLVIIGLMGTGVLALIVRAPGEVPPTRNP